MILWVVVSRYGCYEDYRESNIFVGDKLSEAIARANKDLRSGYDEGYFGINIEKWEDGKFKGRVHREVAEGQWMYFRGEPEVPEFKNKIK